MWGPVPANPAQGGAWRPLAQRIRWSLRRKPHCLLLALKHLLLNTSARRRGHFCATSTAHQAPQDHVNETLYSVFFLPRDCGEHTGPAREGEARTPEPRINRARLDHWFAVVIPADVIFLVRAEPVTVFPSMAQEQLLPPLLLTPSLPLPRLPEAHSG